MTRVGCPETHHDHGSASCHGAEEGGAEGHGP